MVCAHTLWNKWCLHTRPQNKWCAHSPWNKWYLQTDLRIKGVHTLLGINCVYTDLRINGVHTLRGINGVYRQDLRINGVKRQTSE